MDQYEKIRTIGRGTYGDVLLIKRKSDGKLLALKKVIIENINSSSSDSQADLVRDSSASVMSQPGKGANSAAPKQDQEQQNQKNGKQLEIMPELAGRASDPKLGELAHLDIEPAVSRSVAVLGDEGGARSSADSVSGAANKKSNKRFVFESDSASKAGKEDEGDLFDQLSRRDSKRSNNSNETHRALNSEIQILKTLDHANIIKYHESFVYKKRHLCIITEYAANGDLQKKIKEAKNSPAKQISHQQILDWFCQLALGIGHIHSKNILHRDLKPKNILLDKQNRVKIGDFGISKMLENTFDMAKTATGTPYYLSPEVCIGQSYDHKSDMWMLGCILYELCTLRRPFEGDSLSNVLKAITKSKPKRLPKEFSPLFQQLVDLLLQKQANLRASIAEILDLPEIRQNIDSMEERLNAEADEQLSNKKDHAIRYIQPLSQKKHSQIKKSVDKMSSFLLVELDQSPEAPVRPDKRPMTSQDQYAEHRELVDYNRDARQADHGRKRLQHNHSSMATGQRDGNFDGELTFGDSVQNTDDYAGARQMTGKGRPQEEYHGYMHGGARRNFKSKDIDGRRRGSGGVQTLVRRPKGAYEDSSSQGRPCTQSQPQIIAASPHLEGSESSEHGPAPRQRLNSGFDGQPINEIEAIGVPRPATTTWASGGAAAFNYKSNGSISSMQQDFNVLRAQRNEASGHTKSFISQSSGGGGQLAGQKKQRIQEILNKARNLTSPCQNAPGAATSSTQKGKTPMAHAFGSAGSFLAGARVIQQDERGSSIGDSQKRQIEMNGPANSRRGHQMTPEKVVVMGGVQMAGSTSIATADDITDRHARPATGKSKPWRSVERGSAERFMAAPAGAGPVNMRRIKITDADNQASQLGLAARHSMKHQSKVAQTGFIQLVNEESEEADVHVQEEDEELFDQLQGRQVFTDQNQVANKKESPNSDDGSENVRRQDSSYVENMPHRSIFINQGTKAGVTHKARELQFSDEDVVGRGFSQEDAHEDPTDAELVGKRKTIHSIGELANKNQRMTRDTHEDSQTTPQHAVADFFYASGMSSDQHALIEVISPDLVAGERNQTAQSSMHESQGVVGAASRRKLLANNFVFNQQSNRVQAQEQQRHVMNSSFEQEGAKKLLASKKSIVGGTAGQGSRQSSRKVVVPVTSTSAAGQLRRQQAPSERSKMARLQGKHDDQAVEHGAARTGTSSAMTLHGTGSKPKNKILHLKSSGISALQGVQTTSSGGALAAGPQQPVSLSQQQSSTVMKIKQPNQSDIEVQFPKNKRKLNYIKSSNQAHHHGTHGTGSMLNRKSIQINTNLEPSQSKKQYELALEQSKFYQPHVEQQTQAYSSHHAARPMAKKARVAHGSTSPRQERPIVGVAHGEPTTAGKDKKLNASSISCGSITLHFRGSVKDHEREKAKALRTLQSNILKGNGASGTGANGRHHQLAHGQQSRTAAAGGKGQAGNAPNTSAGAKNQSSAQTAGKKMSSGVHKTGKTQKKAHATTGKAAASNQLHFSNQSQMSTGNFYTPNSFYNHKQKNTLVRPNLTLGQAASVSQESFDGSIAMSGSPDRVTKLKQSVISSSTAGADQPQSATQKRKKQVSPRKNSRKEEGVVLQGFKLPNYPRTITNMSMMQQSKIIQSKYAVNPANQSSGEPNSAAFYGDDGSIGNEDDDDQRVNISSSGQEEEDDLYNQDGRGATRQQHNGAVKNPSHHQFVISQNPSPFSSLKKQVAKTPQDNAIKGGKSFMGFGLGAGAQQLMFNSNYSGSGGGLLEDISEDQHAMNPPGNFSGSSGGAQGGLPIEQSNFVEVHANQKQKRKQVYTATNQQVTSAAQHGKVAPMIVQSHQRRKKEVVTSKSGLVQHGAFRGIAAAAELSSGDGQSANFGSHDQQPAGNRPGQSRYFTFDQNGIFNPNNPASPTRSDRATSFLKQKLGKQRYGQIIRLINESENPQRLLDISKEVPATTKTSNSVQTASAPAEGQQLLQKQRQLMQLIKGDRSTLSVLEYIVNCSMHPSGKSSSSINKSSQLSYQGQLKNLGAQAHLHGSSGPAGVHTPNSVYTTNSGQLSGQGTGYGGVVYLKGPVAGGPSASRGGIINSKGARMAGANSSNYKNMSCDSGQYSHDNLGSAQTAQVSSPSGGGDGCLTNVAQNSAGSEEYPRGAAADQAHRANDSSSGQNSTQMRSKHGVKLTQKKLFTPSTQYTNNLIKQEMNSLSNNKSGGQMAQQNFRLKQRTPMGGALGLGGHGLGLAQQLSQPLDLAGAAEHQSNNNSTLSNYQQLDVADNQSGDQVDNGRRPHKLRNLFKQRDLSMEKYRVNINTGEDAAAGDDQSDNANRSQNQHKDSIDSDRLVLQQKNLYHQEQQRMLELQPYAELLSPQQMASTSQMEESKTHVMYQETFGDVNTAHSATGHHATHTSCPTETEQSADLLMAHQQQLPSQMLQKNIFTDQIPEGGESEAPAPAAGAHQS